MAEANAQSIPQQAGGPPPKRRLRNYLLDTKFQLKYTLMVVLVTVVVAGILGYLAYRYSEGQTESLTLTMATQPDLDPAAMAEIEEFAQAEDRKVLLSIVTGILILALVLGFTGIIVTHKVVGPAYKMKRLLREVADGHLRIQGRLRKGDELQDLFIAFENMVTQLRARQADEIKELEASIERAKKAGASEEIVRDLTAFRDRMQKALD